MKLLLAPIALVLFANGVALLNVSRNRSEVRRELELSERELWVHGESRDRSSVSLHLMMSTRVKGLDWLDESRMTALGFRPIRSSEDADQLPRRGFAVLEFDGPEFQRLTEESEATQLKTEGRSRLLIVDFARDAKDLETKYPDPARFLIVRATVSPTYSKPENPSKAEPRRGNIFVDVPSIDVPRLLRSVFNNKPGEKQQFRVRLRFGANYEPWIVSAKSLNP